MTSIVPNRIKYTISDVKSRVLQIRDTINHIHSSDWDTDDTYIILEQLDMIRRTILLRHCESVGQPFAFTYNTPPDTTSTLLDDQNPIDKLPTLLSD